MCFFSPIGNFLMNFSFDTQRCFALLSVFLILSTTLTCRLCCFYGMYADTGFFFFIVDIELGVICWAESLDGSDETRENQVGSATTAYKCWNQETSELLTTLRNNTPMCKNRRSRSEICVFSFFFFPWVNKVLLKHCGVIYVCMHYSAVLPRVLRTQARFLSSSGCSAQSRRIVLLSNATRAFQTCCAQTARADICETKIKASQRLFIKILNLAQSGKSALVVKVALQSGPDRFSLELGRKHMFEIILQHLRRFYIKIKAEQTH